MLPMRRARRKSANACGVVVAVVQLCGPVPADFLRSACNQAPHVASALPPAPAAACLVPPPLGAPPTLALGVCASDGGPA
eukprot:121840-Alexandrium_andersonii.AAC.1